VKCLIIAAGRGSRLSPLGDSKPLSPLLGTTIIERVIHAVSSAGIKEFYVVTGYRGEKVRYFLDGVTRHRNIKIHHLVNPDWQKGNGLSVLKARGVLDSPFILVMSDHLVDTGVISDLKSQRIGNDEVLLAIDRRIASNPYVDMEDVTKVRERGGYLEAVGKSLRGYNAFDTGVFLCTPVIFDAIETSIAGSGDDSLSGGINVLARRRKLRAFDIGDRFWIDIDDRAALRKAEHYLISSLGKPTDGPVSRYFNRPLSTRLTRYLVRTGITPNQISIISFCLSLVAAAFFFFTSYLPLLAGGLVAQISSVIDGCDGEVARLKFRESRFGGWFDAVLDRYADAFMLFGLTYNTYAPSGNILYLITGFFAIIGSFMNSYTADKYDGIMKREPGFRGSIRIGRDVRVFLIFIGAVVYQPFLILLVIALLMNAENIRRVMICYRHSRA
jgi:CDP-L-myo-inositol myo-inositolphosphotransferase